MQVAGASGRVLFDVPEGWVFENGPRKEVESLAFLPGPEGAFAPNAVLTLNDYAGGISEFMADVVNGALQSLEDVTFIDIDPWSPDERTDLGPAGSGRSITYTHRSPRTGARLRATEWLMVGNGLAVQLTTTAGVGQWVVFSDTFEKIAASLRFDGDGVGSVHDNPIPASARDELASEFLGHEVERFAGLRPAQPFPYDEGEWVLGSAMQLFSEMAEGGVGSLTMAGMSDELADLERLGFLEDGALTESGAAIAEFFRTPNASLRLTSASDPSENAVFQAWVSGPAVFISVHGVDTPERPSEDHALVLLRPIGDLSSLMARWVGLQPAWHLPVQPDRLAHGDMVARAHGGGGLPEDANPVLRTLWQEPLESWDILAVGPASSIGPITYLDAGSLGHYSVIADEAGATYLPAPSSVVFDNFEEAIQACLYGRQPVFQ